MAATSLPPTSSVNVDSGHSVPQVTAPPAQALSADVQALLKFFQTSQMDRVNREQARDDRWKSLFLQCERESQQQSEKMSEQIQAAITANKSSKSQRD